MLNPAAAFELTEKLVSIQAVKLRPDEPFTWASGWKSPIYCDNRLTLSYPQIRTWIKNNLAEAVQQKFPQATVLAGVATAGIPHAALVADALQLPMVYVRSEAKKHGLTNQVEGKLTSGSRVVVIEDLISTGMSSLHAVDALREQGAEVLGLLALFTYDFTIAKNQFADAECDFYTLTDYPTLIQYALQQKMIDPSAEAILQQWRENPAAWTVK